MPHADDPRSLDEPLERLRTGSSRNGVIGAIALVAAFVLLTWQPWSPNPGPAPAPPGPTSPVARAVPSSIPASPGASAAPSFPAPSPAAAVGDGTYVSLIDNEWTIVAMLDVGSPASTEEPATQHGAGGVGAGPFLVLQQGAHPMTRRVRDPAATKPLCGSQLRPLDREAVLLPAGRVAYLGITFPGMDPSATVSVAGIGRSVSSLRRVRSPSLALVGLTAGARYLIPSTGSGGTILFAPAPGSILRSGAYRFEIRAPGIAGPRFVYACIGG